MKLLARVTPLACWALIALGFLQGSGVRAEISAGTSGNRPTILGIITDDPDPVVGIRFWDRVHAIGSAFVVLNPDGDANGDGRPSVVWNPASDQSIVAWARQNGSSLDVVFSTYEGGASWSAPLVLAGDVSLDELDPSLVLDPSNGDVHLFYWVDDATPRVMHRQAPADLSSWSSPVQVSSSSDPACRPAGVFHDGVLHVAYEVHDYGAGQTPRQVVLSRKEPGGFVPEVVAITYFGGEPRPQVHSRHGKVWLDWVDASGEMAWIRRDPTGQWEPTRYEPFADPESLEFHVRGAIRMQAAR